MRETGVVSDHMPKRPFADGFGSRLQAARKEAGLSQDAAAAQLGEGFSAISQYRWENDKDPPSIAKVAQMAELYGVSIDWLVGRTPFREVLRPGKVVVDTAALDAARDLADSGGSLEDLPETLVRHPGIDYAWRLPEHATVMDRAAAADVERQMQRILTSLRGRKP